MTPHRTRSLRRLPLLLALACLASVAAAGLLAAVAQAQTVAFAANCSAPTPTQATCLSYSLVSRDLTTAQRDSSAMRNLAAAHRLFTETATAANLSGSGEGGGLSPRDLAAAYKLPPAPAGAGQTVALVDAYGDPTLESDLAVYRAHYQLPPCTTASGCLRIVNQQGTGALPAPPTVGNGSGWTGETALDVDMVSAICPACHILVVEADTQDPGNMMAADHEAAVLGATEISDSFAWAESPSSSSYDTDLLDPGVPVVAGAGDRGYENDQGTPMYPSSSPYVVSVGGTTLAPASDARGFSETAWQNSGGGCSAVEPMPSWQNASLGCTMRLSNDVAAVADPASGVSVYNTSLAGEAPTTPGVKAPGWAVDGGTSAATPIIAATYALSAASAKPTSSSITGRLYAGADAFFDVTSGGNCVPSLGCTGCNYAYECNAETGYDGPTGWGSPDGPFGGTPYPLASAPRVSTLVYDGTTHVFFRWASGTIDAATDVNGTWTRVSLPGEWATGDPTAAIVNSVPTVYYVGGDGHIHADALSGGGWSNSDLGVSATGVPAYVNDNGVSLLFYRAPNGDIDYNPLGTQLALDTNTRCGTAPSPADGSPAVSVTGSGTSTTVGAYFTGTDGNIHTVTLAGGKWTCAAANATGAIGDPSYGTLLAGRGSALAYRSASGDVNVALLGSSISLVDLTAQPAGCKTPAAGDPLVTGTPASVYYIGTDGTIHEDQDAASGWTCTDTKVTAESGGDLSAGPGALLAYLGANADPWLLDTSTAPPAGTDLGASVTALSSANGAFSGGGTLTINGTNLSGATAVYFGGTSAPFTVNSPTSITINAVPSGLDRVDVTVVTPWGTTPTSPDDQYTYDPVIASLSSSTGPTAGGNTVTITLSGVDAVSLANPFGVYVTGVSFGGTPATSSGLPPTFTVTVPPGSAGTVPITVTLNNYDNWFGTPPLTTLITPTSEYTYR